MAVTKTEAALDGFKIDLGKPNTILGEILYSDKAKTKVTQVKVFHAGPSQ